MDPSQGYVIRIGRNGHPFTKTDWKKLIEEGYIINVASVVVPESRFEASHKLNTTVVLLLVRSPGSMP